MSISKIRRIDHDRTSTGNRSHRTPARRCYLHADPPTGPSVSDGPPRRKPVGLRRPRQGCNGIRAGPFSVYTREPTTPRFLRVKWAAGPERGPKDLCAIGRTAHPQGRTLDLICIFSQAKVIMLPERITKILAQEPAMPRLLRYGLCFASLAALTLLAVSARKPTVGPACSARPIHDWDIPDSARPTRRRCHESPWGKHSAVDKRTSGLHCPLPAQLLGPPDANAARRL
jgi:hypothetical protein